jgi:hypothetical protein
VIANDEGCNLWASDGQEPSQHYSIRLDVSLIPEREMLSPSPNCLTEALEKTIICSDVEGKSRFSC